MAKKSNFEKACTAILSKVGDGIEASWNADEQVLQVGACHFSCPTSPDPDHAHTAGKIRGIKGLAMFDNGPVAEDITVGEVMKFIITHLEDFYAPGEPAPPKLGNNGKDLEADMLTEARRWAAKGVFTMERYGDLVRMISRGGGKAELQKVPGLPDFEGVYPGGRQFIIEAKVCSGSAFEVNTSKIKPRQVQHMLERSRFSVPCYVLIHFNERLGKTFYDPPKTFAFPVHHQHYWDGWRKFAEAPKDKPFQVSLSRELAPTIGVRVRWYTPPRCKKVYPDLKHLLLPGSDEEVEDGG